MICIRHILISTLVLIFMTNYFGICSADEKPARRALLVGVTEYQNLSKEKWLKGPENDVALAAEVLLKFGFADKDIVKLTDITAKAKGKILEPTRANIQREFEELAKNAGKDDQVFILMSGHGSQQPAAPVQKSGMMESDGLDETFLPRDIGKWNNESETVANAITDDDIFVWTRDIAAKGAFVFIVFDSCHSGTMLRGDDGEVLREIVRDDPDLGIPKEAFKKAKVQGDSNAGQRQDETHRTTPGKVLAIYAAQPDQTAPELALPQGTPESRTYGLLTYNLFSVLSRAKENGSKLSYRDLAAFLPSQYVSMNRRFPIPSAEFSDEIGDTVVFGKDQYKGPSLRISKSDGGEIKASGGLLGGLWPGVVLEILPPLGGKDMVLGYAKVVKAANMECLVEPAPYKGKPKVEVKDIPDNARCRQVSYHFDEDSQVRVMISECFGSTKNERKPVPAGRVALAKEDLKKWTASDGQPKPWKLVDSRDQADWFVMFWEDAQPDAPGSVSLVPKGGLPLSSGEAVNRGFKLEPGGSLAASLDDAAYSICKVKGLIQLSRVCDSATPNDASPKFDLELRAISEVSQVSADPGKAIRLYGGDGKQPRTGDRVELEVKNNRATELELWIFYISDDFTIKSVYPRLIDRDMILGGNKTRTIKLGNIKSTSTAKSTEHLIVIGLKSAQVMSDLSALEGKGLDTMRSVTRGNNIRGMSSSEVSLKTVLSKHILDFKKPASRGAMEPETELSECIIRWFPLEVVPGIRGKSKP